MQFFPAKIANILLLYTLPQIFFSYFKHIIAYYSLLIKKSVATAKRCSARLIPILRFFIVYEIQSVIDQLRKNMRVISQYQSLFTCAKFISVLAHFV